MNSLNHFRRPCIQKLTQILLFLIEAYCIAMRQKHNKYYIAKYLDCSVQRLYIYFIYIMYVLLHVNIYASAQIASIKL